MQLLAGFTRDAQALYRDGRGPGGRRRPARQLAGPGRRLGGRRPGPGRRGGRGRCAASPRTSPRSATPAAGSACCWRRAQVAVEQRDLGEPFDRVAADFAELGIEPGPLLVPLRGIYVYLAYGRLEQCRTATPEQRSRALAAARRAVADLRRAARLLRAAEGALPGGRGLAAPARRRPGGRARRAGAARLRAARARTRRWPASRRPGCGHTPCSRWATSAEATVAAAGALALAARYEWPHRAAVDPRRVRRRRPRRAPSATAPGSPTPTSPPPRTGTRLDAVAAMSLASARILDPAELTRVALDETIRLLVRGARVPVPDRRDGTSSSRTWAATPPAPT